MRRVRGIRLPILKLNKTSCFAVSQLMPPVGSLRFSAISLLLVVLLPFLRLCCVAQIPESSSCCAHPVETLSLCKATQHGSHPSEDPNLQKLDSNEESGSGTGNHDCPCCGGMCSPLWDGISRQVLGRYGSYRVYSPDRIRPRSALYRRIFGARDIFDSTCCFDFFNGPPIRVPWDRVSSVPYTADLKWRTEGTLPNASLRILLLEYAAPNAPP